MLNSTPVLASRTPKVAPVQPAPTTATVSTVATSTSTLTATPSVVASSVAPTAKVPWTEKYRPATVNDVGGHREHDAFKRTMLRGMLDGDVPHLLLYGPPGTGKTSLMLALAREVYGAQHIKHMLMEVNASDDNSLESLQSQWQPFAEAPNIHTQFAFKWIVLDEADALPADVQKVLRRLMERTMDRTRFCLICNHVERISMPLQSRCTMVAFRPLPTEFMLARLQHIVDAEQLRCDDASTTLPLLVELCKGDMRRAINLLQAIALTHDGHVSAETVYLTHKTPTPAEVDEILSWFDGSVVPVAHMAHAAPMTPLPCSGSSVATPLVGALAAVHRLQRERCWALHDIIQYVWPRVVTYGTVKDLARTRALIELGEIEQRLISDHDPTIQASAFGAAMWTMFHS